VNPVREAPVVETPRLILRAYVLDDFPHVAATWADERVVRYISGGRPFTEEETWARFLRNIALWPMLGYGYWAATERSTGRYLGDVGFADFKREIEPSLKGVPEIGWVLSSSAHGRGYATEAARALLAFGFDTLGLHRVYTCCDAENLASARVMEKIGMQREGLLRRGVLHPNAAAEPRDCWL